VNLPAVRRDEAHPNDRRLVAARRDALFGTDLLAGYLYVLARPSWIPDYALTNRPTS